MGGATVRFLFFVIQISRHPNDSSPLLNIPRHTPNIFPLSIGSLAAFSQAIQLPFCVLGAPRVARRVTMTLSLAACGRAQKVKDN